MSAIPAENLPIMVSRCFPSHHGAKTIGLGSTLIGAKSYKKVIVQGKAAVEYWATFRLDTPAEVMRWHQDQVAGDNEHGHRRELDKNIQDDLQGNLRNNLETQGTQVELLSESPIQPSFVAVEQYQQPRGHSEDIQIDCRDSPSQLYQHPTDHLANIEERIGEQTTDPAYLASPETFSAKVQGLHLPLDFQQTFLW